MCWTRACYLNVRFLLSFRWHVVQENVHQRLQCKLVPDSSRCRRWRLSLGFVVSISCQRKCISHPVDTQTYRCIPSAGFPAVGFWAILRIAVRPPAHHMRRCSYIFLVCSGVDGFCFFGLSVGQSWQALRSPPTFPSCLRLAGTRQGWSPGHAA